MPESRNLIGTRLGNCELVEKIGEGGMGAVYRGRDRALDRNVAVKILPEALAADKSYVARFIREARALAKVKHPNLISIYQVGQKNGLYFFMMEFVEGRTLAALLAQGGGGMAVPEAFRILGQVMRALSKVHSLGIVHRDIKSSNVMINSEGQAILMDFGLAKEPQGDSSLTTAGVILGTPDYMSPEQANGDPVDTRSDIYSLGILAFQMLTGRLPFPGKSAVAILKQHCHDPLPGMANLAPGIPEAVDRIVRKAAAKRPDERFQNLGEMTLAMRKVSDNPALSELAADAVPTGARTIKAAVAGAQSAAASGKRLYVWLWAALAVGALVVALALILGGLHRKESPPTPVGNTGQKPPAPEELPFAGIERWERPAGKSPSGLPPKTPEAVLEMKDGRKIAGSLNWYRDGKISITTKAGDEMTILREEVKAIRVARH